MGNCLSCCIVESYEIGENQYLFINKINKPNQKNHKKQTVSYYDSCVF
jgi:hypothetical protein